MSSQWMYGSRSTAQQCEGEFELLNKESTRSFNTHSVTLSYLVSCNQWTLSIPSIYFLFDTIYLRNECKIKKAQIKWT